MALNRSEDQAVLVNMIRKESPDWFYQRFGDNGEILNPDWPRVKRENVLDNFKARDTGLHFLLINAPIREWSYPNIMPIGQGYVAAVAIMDGHHVDVLDLNAERISPVEANDPAFSQWVEDQLLNRLIQSKPDVIGLGGIITQFSRLQQIARICKTVYPDVPIILGGGIGSSMPEFMVERLPADVVIQEEGEITISEVLRCLEEGTSLDNVKGIAFKKSVGVEEWTVKDNGHRPSVKAGQSGLDYLPWPMRTLWPLDQIYKVNPVGHLNWATKWIDGASVTSEYCVSMIASRGCPYASRACDYCYAAYLGTDYRLRSPKEVVDEMEWLKDRYEISYIHFLDDLMLTDYRWALEFCNELKDRRDRTGFEVLWGGTCRTNIVAADIQRAKREGRPNMLEQAYSVGMRQVGYGIESGSPTILASIDKSGQTPERIAEAVKETQRVMGYADCSFIIGSPGETQETIQETVDLCRQIGLAPEVFFFTTAYPGTAFWDLAMEKGLIKKAVTGQLGPADDDIVEQYFLLLGEQGDTVRTNFSDLSDDEIVELSWWAVNELGAQNTVRHPHTGESQVRIPEVRGASRADL